MGHWKQLMSSAKQAYKQQSFYRAISLNNEALCIAENEFLNVFSKQPDEAVAMVIVSYLSLSDSHIGNLHHLSAYQCFEAATLFISDAFQYENLTNMQYLALIRGAQQLRFEFSNFHSLYGIELSSLKTDVPPMLAARLDSLFSTSTGLH